MDENYLKVKLFLKLIDMKKLALVAAILFGVAMFAPAFAADPVKPACTKECSKTCTKACTSATTTTSSTTAKACCAKPTTAQAPAPKPAPAPK